MNDPVNVSELGPEDRAALQRLILTLADSKRLMGIRYSDWLLGSPTIESGIAMSSMAQDEWGHARLLYAILKELDVDPVSIEHDRSSDAYASVGALDDMFADWATVIAGVVVVDGALAVALEAFSRGRIEQARTRVPKMLAEESYHASLGRAWYARLAESSDESRGLLRAATESMLPGVLAWLGAADEPARAMVAAEVMEPADALLARYRDDMRDLLAMAGVDVDAVQPESEWDGTRGRGPGHPDDEAIERVRGDRNRALFVE